MRNAECTQSLGNLVKNAMTTYHENVFNGPNGETPKLVNMTPHPIDFFDANGDIYLTIPSSGIARVIFHRNYVGKIDGIPVKETEYREVYGLPEPQPGIYYIVSMLVAVAVKGTRDDCLTVDATIRDDDGNSIGCRSLGKV